MRKLFVTGLVFLSFTSLANEQKNFTTEEYIDKWKITAIEQMNEHQIPASITLAQGILESANGNSRLARHANNHFGIKCHQTWDGDRFYQDDDAKNECFRSYESAAQSYDDHSLFLTSRSRYSKLFELELTDYKGWAKGLKSAGYATNPKYAHLLIDIIEKYDLSQYDNMPYLPHEQQEEELSITVEEPEVIIAEPVQYQDEEIGEFKLAHDVHKNQYNKRYIVVQEGDTFYRIAKEFDMGLWQLYKYNELGKRDVLIKGEKIYLDPKRNKSKRGSNILITEGAMTLRMISQEEGIKLKKLLKYNFGYTADQSLPVGTKVILR